MKLLTIAGARPQFIKAAVVSRAIGCFNKHQGENGQIREILVHTGQHYDADMSAVFFQELGIPAPAHQLGVGSGPHGQQTGRMLEGLERVMKKESPDCVLVYGDTNSTLAGGLAACKLQTPVAHVEAGLRSYNRAMPEETNRVVVDHLSSFLFCPTERAVKNLGCEGIVTGVHLVGDVMYDSLLYNLERAAHGKDILSSLGLARGEYALATIHRAENTDSPETLRGLILELGRIGLPVVMPLHPRTRVALETTRIGQSAGKVRLIPPVSYQEMLILEQHARLILTDSGGVQKEAFLLRVPCVTLRNETEWVETVEAGWNRLVGTAPNAIAAAVLQCLEHLPPYPPNPYGGGDAAKKILRVLSQLACEEVA